VTTSLVPGSPLVTEELMKTELPSVLVRGDEQDGHGAPVGGVIVDVGTVTDDVR
jgi:hypothetical protein